MKLEIIASPLLLKFELPKFATPGAAAVDLRALLNSPLSKLDGVETTMRFESGKGIRSYIILRPGQQVLLDTGLKIHIKDPAYCAMIVPRSSSAKLKIALGNTVGLIDSDYQGPLFVSLLNRGTEPVVIDDGERIAQYFLTSVIQFDMTFVNEFSANSDRGQAGFGSTGRV